MLDALYRLIKTFLFTSKTSRDTSHVSRVQFSIPQEDKHFDMDLEQVNADASHTQDDKAM